MKCTVKECLFYIRLSKTSIDPRDILSFIQIESSFDPNARRDEPRLGESSYGLMQLLYSTARGMGLNGDASLLLAPSINIRIGIKYLEWITEYLTKHLGQTPSKKQWVEAYNEGIGNVVKNVPDPQYWDRWIDARKTFEYIEM